MVKEDEGWERVFFKLDHDSDLYISFIDIGLRWLKSGEQLFVKY